LCPTSFLLIIIPCCPQIDSGRTSAVIHHTINEKADGSGRRVTLVDLAGHEKYLRTTICESVLVEPDLTLLAAFLLTVLIRGGNMGGIRHFAQSKYLFLAISSCRMYAYGIIRNNQPPPSFLSPPPHFQMASTLA
jgi:hypothetical protein